jgi:Flp pilus assembly protein TadD
VPIPQPLGDILTQTAITDGPDAAAAQLHDLRAKYYGAQAYDFSERAMIALGERLVNARPQAAVALMQASLQYYPGSSVIYMMLGIAQSNASDYQRAIESLRKALELDPANNLARGRLAQVEQAARPPR